MMNKKICSKSGGYKWIYKNKNYDKSDELCL